MLRVIVADDEPVIRNGIVHLIESSGLDLKVAGTAEDGREAVELVQKLDPEIIIMDINMPQLNGLEAIGEIRKSSPDCRILIVSGYSDFAYAQQAIDLGVFKYLLKPLDIHGFVPILQQAMDSWTQLHRKSDPASVSEEDAFQDKGLAAFHYVRDHFTENTLNLTDAAQRFYLSPSYLSRIIKEKTSLSFTDYLNRLRIDLAESLMLENPGMTMNEVALQCGYSSQHSFSRAFKNYTGMTPIAFKNKPR